MEHKPNDRMRYARRCEHSGGWRYSNGKSTTQTPDRDKLAGTMAAMGKAMQNYHHHRDIVTITIDKDKKSATVESTESASFDMAGQHVASTGHAIDVIRLDGDSLVFVRSTGETTTKAEKRTRAKPAPKS